MYYYGARYYDPRISIFVSVDPMAEKTMQPYVYAGNNPVNMIDPNGLEPIPWSLKAILTDVRKPWQWYNYGYGLYDKSTFNSAAKYNTNNLRSSAYQSVYQRNAYYGWAQSQADAKGYNSKWFVAAQLVTGFRGVGGTEIPDGGMFSSSAVDKFLQGGE